MPTPISVTRRYYAGPIDNTPGGVNVAHAVKWGIISTADINRKVIPGAHASPAVDLVAVASRDQARADAYGREWEIPRAYGSYEGLVADDENEGGGIFPPHTMPLGGGGRGRE